MDVRATCQGNEQHRQQASDKEMERILTETLEEFRTLWLEMIKVQGSREWSDSYATCFDECMRILGLYHVVEGIDKPPDEGAFIHFSCSCPQYQDTGVCKHVLSEGLHQGKFTSRNREVAIGKRKGGRPKKNRPRVVQPSDLVAEEQPLTDAAVSVHSPKRKRKPTEAAIAYAQQSKRRREPTVSQLA